VKNNGHLKKINFIKNYYYSNSVLFVIEFQVKYNNKT
jgi:hypothetical protein